MAYRTQVHTFGPGSLESLTLRLWQNRRDQEHLVARLEGTYTVYCGAGNSHTVSIKEEMHGWVKKEPGCILTVHEQLHWDIVMLQAFQGVEGSAREIADQLVEYGLEDWTDPCDNFSEPLDFSDAQE